MKEKWKQIGWKRMLALVLVFVLVVGLMPQGSVKAAGEMDATLTYGGFADQPTIGTGRWLIYADLSTEITATIPTSKYLGFVYASMNDSSETFALDVYAASTTRVFYPLNYSKLGVSAPSELAVGTTVTLKARTVAGYINVRNDFTIYWTGSGWKELRQLGLSTISSQQQAVLTTTNTELQTLFDSKGNTNDMPLTGVGDACVYLNGNPTSKKTVNYSRWGLYLDASSIKGSNYAVGDVLRVKGIFSQTVNSNVYYEMDESFVCIAASGTNTATWVYRSELSIKTNTQGTLYLLAGQIVANSGDYNVFGATGATLTYNGTAISRASNNYFLYSASENGLRIYLAEYGITQQNQGDIIYISGTFSCNGKAVNFGENWFLLQSDGTWLHATEEPDTQTSFTITNGSYTFQDWSNLNRWAMTFDTSESLGAPSELTYLGEYKILVNGEEKTAPFYMTTAGKLQIFVGQATIPQVPEEGMIVTIPAQELKEACVLSEDYSIIFDRGQWKQYNAGIDATLSVHGSWGNQSNAATIYPSTGSEAETASLTLSTGDYLAPVYADAGIWYNGEKLDPSKGLYLINGGTYVRYQVILSDYNLIVQKNDIITIKGIFNKDDVYLNFKEIHLMYNGTSWGAVSYSYDDLTLVSLDELLSAVPQDTDTLQRWLFKMQPSVTLEAATAGWGTDFAGYSGNMEVQIYHEDAPEIITETTSTALHAQYNGADGYFGLILNFAVLPENADGYVMIIKPGIFRSTNYIYKFEKEFKIKNTGGTWEIVQERPTATGIPGDANGDGVLNVADIVREKWELTGLAGKGGIKLCTEDAFLNGKTEMLRQVDLISLYEIILRGNILENDVPLYLEDNEIMLAAYEGPRSGGKTNYHYENGTLVNDGTVNRSYLNAAEFQRFAAAGLNTVFVQADASFDSKALKGANDAMLQNLNTYMELAAKADVNVIVYSDYLNSFLKGRTSKTWTGTELAMNEENLTTELQELWNGHANAKGMKEYENFKGIMMSDELESTQIGNYETAINVLKGISGDIGFYSSQYSMTAASSHFTDFGGSTAAERFINSAKAFGTLAGNFVYDMYPLRTNSTGSSSTVTEQWLYNLQLSAETGRDNGFDTGVTVQSAGHVRNPIVHDYIRDPVNKEDIGFQVYTALAYGMKAINYYTYWEHHAQYSTTNAYEAYTSAMVLYPDDPEAEDAEGVETDVYRAVAAVNNEINKFDHVFMEYDWLGTMALNVNNKDNLYDNLTSYSSGRITSATAAGGDALIGCMYDSIQGYDGFWIVNGTAPNNAADSTVNVKFDSSVTRLMVYDPTAEGFNGSAKMVSYDAAGGYTATIGCGEGQFVIPLK